MTERNPFERTLRSELAGLPCEQWEAMLADALDGTLSMADQAVFQAHSGGCTACAEVLRQARQGREWLTFLREDPEIPTDLTRRILARTTGAGHMPAAPEMAIPGVIALPGMAAAQPPSGLHVGHFASQQRAFLNARFLMTAAMAFFSIGITLNAAGVKLTQLRLADLKPASMEVNLSRQFYGTKGQIVRYYDNLRVVYEVEARMRELRQETDSTQEAAPASKQGKPTPKGSARKNGSQMAMPDGALHGPPVVAHKGQGAAPLPSRSGQAALAFYLSSAAEGGLL